MHLPRLATTTALLLALSGCSAGSDGAGPLTVPNPSPTAATAAPTGSTPPPPAPAPGGGTYPVDRVVDGDTVRILRDGESVALRLIGGDTPETVHPRMDVQCYGPEASAEARQLLEGERVRVVYDPTQGRLTDDGYRVDAYDRDLVYLHLPDGRDYMEHMIEQGYAEEYTYRGSQYERQDEYRAAEERAIENDRGIWAHC